MTNLDKVLKSRDITLPTKVCIVKAMIFSWSHKQSWELDSKEGSVTKNWWLQTMLLEKTLESPWGSKDIKPVNLEGNQPWIFIGRTDAEVETPVFWSSNENGSLLGKVPNAGKDWGQKKVSEDEMAGWHHWCNGHELGQLLGNGEGQRGLVHCSPWSDTTGPLNNHNNYIYIYTTSVYMPRHLYPFIC